MLRLAQSTFIVGLALLVLLFGIRPVDARTQSNQRLVVVGGALTEIVYALGAGNRIVGTDTTSQWPVGRLSALIGCGRRIVVAAGRGVGD